MTQQVKTCVTCSTGSQAITIASTRKPEFQFNPATSLSPQRQVAPVYLV